MGIFYDEQRKRAIDLETGVAVELERFGLPKERDVHFRLLINNEDIPFEGSYDFGDSKIRSIDPDMDPVTWFEKQLELNEQNFFFSDFAPGVDFLLKKYSNFPELFVSLVHYVVSHNTNGRRNFVYYRPYIDLNQGEWRAEP